jgi:hypothetical protein
MYSSFALGTHATIPLDRFHVRYLFSLIPLFFSLSVLCCSSLSFLLKKIEMQILVRPYSHGTIPLGTKRNPPPSGVSAKKEAIF